MAAIFLAPFYLFFIYYILLWLYAWAEALFPGLHTLWFRAPAAFLLLFFAVSPLTSFLVKRKPLRHALKVLANYWLGAFEYILLTVLVFDMIRRITRLPVLADFRYPHLLHTMPQNLLIFGGIAVVLVCVVSGYGIFHAKQIKICRYQMTCGKACALPSLRIALIADLHIGYNATASHLRSLVDQINSQAPDLVCIAGDIFDNEYEAIHDPQGYAEILSGIQSRYGVYCCLGNHDVSEAILAGFTFPSRQKLDREFRFMKFLADSHIRLLEDETVFLANAFYLAGRKDPDMAKKEKDKRLSFSDLTAGLDKTRPIFVMDHQPKELKEAADAGVDFDLSGHTHGGQAFPSNLVVRLFWKNSYGVRKVENMYSIVTSGAGVWGPAMRVGSDNEVVVLDVNFRPQ